MVQDKQRQALLPELIIPKEIFGCWFPEPITPKEILCFWLPEISILKEILRFWLPEPGIPREIFVFGFQNQLSLRKYLFSAPRTNYP